MLSFSLITRKLYQIEKSKCFCLRF